MFRLMSMLLCLAMMYVVVSARPRYIVIPLDDTEVVEGGWGPVRRADRVARQAWLGETGDQAPEQDGRVERQAHGHHEHVDYGAHTGHHGAFGWYADFPVKTDH
ncbi:uncharacterized protein LOC128988694 [Macrosteles quadrilineatus]|uniref:uncharacterized protein LOC128988694 n=1 Tax=Macrosteles quadrilineatus TaxID=74068 RepID=UPI0023E34A2D|nr:uncharacterized protein LOC128988694 [Macrosteles quadrilineatus]